MLSQSPWLLLSHIQSLGCIQHTLQCTLRYYSFLWGLSAVNPLPMCSHHGSTCPIVLRALVDKVTGLIDASPPSPPVHRFNTNLHFWGVREESPCRVQRYRCSPLQTPSSVSATTEALLPCTHSFMTPACDRNLCPLPQKNDPTTPNCPRKTEIQSKGQFMSCYAYKG